MAASFTSKIGGYQCEFVEVVSEDFMCGLCNHVAREPHVTSCCGETVCKACITPVLENKKPCPSCETAEFTTLLNVKYQRRILALEVRCIMKDRGCNWNGKLEDLEAHLDVNTGDCEYVNVECPKGCNQPVEKRNLPTHLTDLCPKREFTCQYCNFKATYDVVSNDHWPQCPFYPVPCPNACGIQAIERGDLEAHLLQCPLEEVECDFSHAGCNTKLPRQDLERHMEGSTQKHLVLMSDISLSITKEFKQKLQEQQDLFEQRLQEQQNTFTQKLHEQQEQNHQITEELQKKTQENEAKIRNLQQQLQQKARQVEVLEQQTALQREFEMPNFKEYKEKKDAWFSPSLYTHLVGYSFCVSVWANGAGLGAGTHVAVCLFSVKDEFDSQLKWPAKCTITLQLLNQERDQDHVTVTETFKWMKPKFERNFVAYFTNYQLIAHKDLQYNAQKQTCYLKNDCLLFRIPKVELN